MPSAHPILATLPNRPWPLNLQKLGRRCAHPPGGPAALLLKSRCPMGAHRRRFDPAALGSLDPKAVETGTGRGHEAPLKKPRPVTGRTDPDAAFSSVSPVATQAPSRRHADFGARSKGCGRILSASFAQRDQRTVFAEIKFSSASLLIHTPSPGAARIKDSRDPIISGTERAQKACRADCTADDVRKNASRCRSAT